MTEDRLDNLEMVVASLRVNDEQQWRLISDHAQRFDTLQTPWPKRLWFWLQGWPWYDLNGVRKRRPWHRGD